MREWRDSGIRADELATDGMKSVRVEGREIVVCNAVGASTPWSGAAAT